MLSRYKLELIGCAVWGIVVGIYIWKPEVERVSEKLAEEQERGVEKSAAQQKGKADSDKQRNQ